MQLEKTDKKYKTTKSMVYSCQYHCIFTTKYRRKVLSDIIQIRLKEIILSLENENFDIIEIETMPDHVHLLIDVNPHYGVYSAISFIKGKTSNILRKEFPELKSKLPTMWTRSKFVSSVGAVSLEVVKKYIENQK